MTAHFHVRDPNIAVATRCSTAELTISPILGSFYCELIPKSTVNPLFLGLSKPGAPAFHWCRFNVDSERKPQKVRCYVHKYMVSMHPGTDVSLITIVGGYSKS